MLGYANPGELLERSVFDLTRPEDHERVKADITTTLETGTLRNAEYLLLTEERRCLPGRSECGGGGGRGRPTQWDRPGGAGDHRAQTGRGANSTAGRRGAKHAGLICITDQENRFIFANRAFLQTYGYTAEEIMGRTPDFLSRPRIHRGFANSFSSKRCVAAGRAKS